MSDKYVLFYNQPTVEKGKTVSGKTWYAKRRPGDGGMDWEYTATPSEAGEFTISYVHKWQKLHGPRAQSRKVPQAPVGNGNDKRVHDFNSGPEQLLSKRELTLFDC